MSRPVFESKAGFSIVVRGETREGKTVTNSATLQRAIANAISFNMSARGRVALPGVTGAVEPYAKRLERLFAHLGKPFSAKELVQLCENLAKSLETAAAQDSPTQLLVSYEPAPFPRQGLVYGVQVARTEAPINALLTQGQLVLPCVPALCDAYLKQLANLFAGLTYPLNEEQRDRLRQMLQRELEKGFVLSPQSRIRVVYGTGTPPQTGLNCKVSVAARSLSEQARDILAKTPDYLEKLPSLTKVTDVGTAIDPQDSTALVATVGTAQHALPLARHGFAVDAFELATPFAAKLRDLVESDNLAVSVTTDDILDPLVSLKPNSYRLAVVSEVASRLQNGDALKALLSKLANALVPGGTLLFNLFLADDGVEFDRVALEAARAANSTIVTRSQLEEVLADLPLTPTNETPVLDYERQHRPEDAPKLDPWYVRWAAGQQVFATAKPPISLHWITCDRTSDTEPSSSEPVQL
ncbi:SAM-dependent methyltransferase [Geitlerinema sp. FC II]|nr:SAM-dependent methyltransferase [Geitlerinema sp. FC II]